MKKSKASILAVSLIIMGVMIVIALGISFSSLQSRKSSIGSSKSNVAFQNADSGVEVVMQKIKDHSSDDNLNNFDNTDGLCDGILNLPGKYKSELKKTDGTPVVCGDPVRDIATIKSTGYSSQDSRAIEAAVAQAGGTLQCNTITNSGTNPITVNCLAGDTMTGGGAVWRSDGNDAYVSSYPTGNGWYCRDNDGPLAGCYVRCCRVQ